MPLRYNSITHTQYYTAKGMYRHRSIDYRDLSVEKERQRESEKHWIFKDGTTTFLSPESRRHVRKIWHCLSLPASELWLRPLVKSSRHVVDVVWGVRYMQIDWHILAGLCKFGPYRKRFPLLGLGLQENRHDLGCSIMICIHTGHRKSKATRLSQNASAYHFVLGESLQSGGQGSTYLCSLP